jgi:diguanylate cyclase (GGDEF)-like protein/PAS domain S-box-containing protein
VKQVTSKLAIGTKISGMRANHDHEGLSTAALAPHGPADEAQRLLELRQLGILDTPPEESFDRVTRLAARTLGVPIALVSLVDGTREWFKSRLGVDATQLSRDISFSAHAINGNELLIVPDTTLDDRFATNPLVTGPLHVRACLAIPLCTKSGRAIGALCALDSQPRHFDAGDLEVWRDFTGIVQDTMRARELAVESDWLLRSAASSEQKHTEIERRLQKIADSIPALIGYWNRELRCEFANDAYHAYFGIPAEQMIGLHLRDLLGERLFELNIPHAHAALAGEAQRFQRRVTRADGTTRDTEGQYLPDRDETGSVRGFYVLVTDVSELTAAKGELELSNARLLKESTTDFLTGLANRRVFSERSEAAYRLFRETGDGYALILLDLDNFKQINDGLGHEVGDEVLRAVGRILGEQLRGRDDLAAPLGGEEFAILCPGTFTEESLFELAGRIRGQINATTVLTPKGPARFTSSFGIACSNAEDAGWTSSFARADSALYEAKEAGKDRIIFGHSPARGATGRFRSMGIPTAG